MKKVLRVQFFVDGGVRLDPREYDYFFDGEAAAGNLAVVKVGNEFKVTKIKQVLSRSNKAEKWVYIVFSEEGVEAARLKEEQRSDILVAIEERMKQVSFMTRVKEAATSDETLSKLVAELEGLDK